MKATLDASLDQPASLTERQTCTDQALRGLYSPSKEIMAYIRRLKATV